MTSSQSQHVADLRLPQNEASGLLPVDQPSILHRSGWDRAFWTVLDEPAVQDAIALIGHRAGAPLHEGWGIDKLSTRRADEGGEAQDAESLARWDGWVYLVGSHHGGKRGPVRRRQQWVARFREDELAHRDGAVALQVVNDDFHLHRLLNDALRDTGIDVVEMRPQTRAAFIDPVVARLEGTQAQGRVRPDDWTVNIEGVTFAPDGSLLVGLRFPVSADGQPLLIRLAGVEGMFHPSPSWPEVTGVCALEAVGREGSMAGVRDMTMVGDELHVVTGDLDSAGKGSVIRDEYHAGDQTVSTHWRVSLQKSLSGVLAAEPVREFAGYPRIEGIAHDTDGGFFYVSDEDEAVALHVTPLLAAP
jgi:hypothetical protein